MWRYYVSVLLDAPVRRFGVAEVEFETSAEPVRRDNVLALPFAFSDVQMHTLLGGEQFLLTTAGRTFFGGTDEQPFLVELRPFHRERFERDGEEAFYQGLMPARMRRYEASIGTQAVRQGDIYALPLGTSWEALEHYFIRSTSYRMSLDVREGTHVVDRTRHTLEGRWTTRRVRLPRDRGYTSLQGFTAEGVLHAPDHDDVALDGPHLLMRTQGIIEPRRGQPRRRLPSGVANGD